jgi:hypothetical protein
MNLNIHQVTKIQQIQVNHGDFTVQRFNITTEDPYTTKETVFELTLFPKDGIPLEISLQCKKAGE